MATPTMTAATPSAAGEHTARSPLAMARDVLARPLVDYYMIVSCTLLLSVVGIVMVMSSSGAISIENSNNVWAFAMKQTYMILIGFVCMWFALWLKPATVRRMAVPLMLLSLTLLVLVLFIGHGGQQVGSQSWFSIGAVNLQPSEVAKVVLGIFGAAVFCSYPKGHPHFLKATAWFLGVSMVTFGLIVLQHDMGMAAAVATMFFLVLIFAGVRFLALAIPVVAGGAVLLWILAISGGFRQQRITTYLGALRGEVPDPANTGYQSNQGFLSLAEGSLTGVGLGQSRAKWFYLPASQNDFVFSIYGEETGLVGGTLLILLYTVLLFFGLRCAWRQHSRFLALLSASLTCGVVVQAYINIGYVIGLLPVTGIQLPLISTGGTSAVITLGALGLVANCARHEPEAAAAMQATGRPFFDRLFLIPEPTTIEAEAPKPARPKAKNKKVRSPITESTSTVRTRQRASTRTTTTPDRPYAASGARTRGTGTRGSGSRGTGTARTSYHRPHTGTLRGTTTRSTPTRTASVRGTGSVRATPTSRTGASPRRPTSYQRDDRSWGRPR